MIVRGHFAAKYFDYVSIKVLGCELGADLCLADDKIQKTSINFLEVKAHPSLDGDDSSGIEDVVIHDVD